MGLTREIEYSTEVTNLKQTKYKRYWTAISVTWGIFTICGCVMNIVAFIQPQWIGDTEDSPGVGFFGLYERCERLQGGDKSCRGDFMNFNTILNNSFKAASILMGISNLCMLLCVLSLLLFFFIKPGKVFKIAGWLQLLSCACIVASVVVYPNGWGDKEVMRICGNKGKYDIGRCFVRWAYILAIVLFFNGFALAVLAFMLTNKQADLLKKQKEKEAHHNPMYDDTTDFGVIPFTVNEGFTPDSSFNKGSFGHSSNGGSFMKAELTGVQAEDHGDVGDADNLPEKDDIRL